MPSAARDPNDHVEVGYLEAHLQAGRLEQGAAAFIDVSSARTCSIGSRNSSAPHAFSHAT